MDRKTRIILDTDMTGFDDVGALALLHTIADSGKVKILATVSSNKHTDAVPSIDLINTYFGRPDIPTGAPSEGPTVESLNNWSDSIISKYPQKINSTAEANDAVKVYRKVLNSQQDQSVVIITTGFLTNLASLLDSKADKASNLNGEELVSKKVSLLVCMAGQFPSGREFNLYTDSVASQKVFSRWPGKVIFTGYEIGSIIFTGRNLVNSSIPDNPVKDVFRIGTIASGENTNGIQSWDQTAVLIGVNGTGKYFSVTTGRIAVRSDGSNEWSDDPAGRQNYVVDPY